MATPRLITLESRSSRSSNPRGRLFHLLAWEALAVYAAEPGMAARINRPSRPETALKNRWQVGSGSGKVFLSFQALTRFLGLDDSQATPNLENRDEFRNPNQAFGDDVPGVRHLERLGLDARPASGRAENAPSSRLA